MTIRKSEKDQYKYLVGKKGEGIAWGDVGKGAQVTPPRRHLTELVDKYLPMDSDTFSPLESLAYGGLGAGWGLQCWEFSKPDLNRTGLNESKMRQAYEVVSGRIGISATADSVSDYTIGSLQSYQLSPNADRNHSYILRNYAKKTGRFEQGKVFVGRTPLSLITNDLDDRLGYQYKGLDFYSIMAIAPAATSHRRQAKNSTQLYVHKFLLVVSFAEK